LKITKNSNIQELATIVCQELLESGIKAVLTGGAVVSIYTNNEYESKDLDFITESSRKEVGAILKRLGFKKENKYYKHPKTEFFVEFPSPPLAIGDEPIKEWNILKSAEGKLLLLSPTHSVMDRLAGYYHWNDLQNLDQAIMVAAHHPINLSKVKKWSEKEGMTEKFNKFKDKLRLVLEAKST